jgi:hypothetical protein
VIPPHYQGLYFNPSRSDDLAVLAWLLALPRSTRSRAIKMVLARGLPRYVRRYHPGIHPLLAEEVVATVGRRPAARPQRAGSPPPAATPSPAGRHHIAGAEVADPVARPGATPRVPAEGERRDGVERKLDQLLARFR